MTKCASALWLSCVVICFGISTSANGQQEDSFQIPDEIVCRGIVKDVTGELLPEANVTLVSPKSGFWSAQTIGTELKTLETTTDLDGRFEIRFSRSDPPFLAHGDMKLIVSALGHGMTLSSFEMPRLLIDLPFEFQLEKSRAFPLKVLDPNGQPIAGAKVSPAHIGNEQIDLASSRFYSKESNQDGTVQINFTTPTSLREVFVETAAFGNQRLPVIAKDNSAVVNATAIGRLRLKFNLPDGADASALAGHNVQVVSKLSNDYLQGALIPSGWQTSSLDENGVASFDRLAIGSLTYFVAGSFPFVSKDAYIPLPTLTDSDEPLEFDLDYLPASDVVFTFIDESGEPLSNIDFGSYTRGFPDLTDAKGQALLQVGEGKKLDGQLFPFDAFSEHIVVDPFGIHLERRQPDENGNTEPIVMVQSHGIVGEIIDDLGNMVPGATVFYSYSRERFNAEYKTLSDRHGRFQIRGLPPSTAVNIRAQKQHWLTRADESIDAVSKPVDQLGDSLVRLTLHEQAVAVPFGRLVDQDGKPVTGVRVSIDKAIPFQIEGFGPEDIHSQPLSDPPKESITNAQGVFRFPPTVDFAKRLQVKVDDRTFFTFRSHFMDGAKRQPLGGELDLGTFTLIKRPEPVLTTIQIKDAETNQPISNVQVVTVGMHSGKNIAAVDKSGTVHVSLPNTGQLLGIQADGYRIEFRFLEEIQEAYTIHLTRLEMDEPLQRLSWFDRPVKEYQQVAGELFSTLEQPAAGESTYYRQWLYLRALATNDVEQFAKLISDPQSPYEYREQFIQQLINQVLNHSLTDAIRLLDEVVQEPRTRSWMYGSFAFALDDLGLKKELYGEAVIAANQCSGEEMLRATGLLASLLVLDDQSDAARALMDEAWRNATEWREVVQSGKPKFNRGLARTFGPALVAFQGETGAELIRLLADQNEIEYLTNQGLAMMSLVDWDAFEAFCESQGIHPTESGVDQFLTRLEMHRHPRPHLENWAARFADKLPDCIAKIKLYLVAAKETDDRSARDELMAKAVKSYENTTISIEYYWSDPAKFVLEELINFDKMEPHQLDAMIFACMMRSPKNYEAPNAMGLYANLSRLLAMKDESLAKDLLEPAFRDINWLHQYRSGSEFDRNFPLRAAVWVDPHWAGQIAEHIITTHERDKPIRRLETVSGILESTGELTRGR